MVARISILNKISIFRYILLFIILTAVGTLYYMVTYGQAGIGQQIVTSWSTLQPTKSLQLKFKADDILYSNHTFRLLGRYLVNNSVPLRDLYEVEIDTLTIEKIKMRILLEKQNAYKYRKIKVQRVNCQELFKGNKTELNLSKKFMVEYKRPSRSNDWYVEQTQDCDKFKINSGYVTSSLTKEEENFPIAFSLLIFINVEQVEKLLRAIYRPQNFYCIHVDIKAKDGVRKAMTSIANCFDNVFISSRSVDVQWGKFTVLEPELICMQELWKYKKWKYFINLTGQEFPLKTNKQLVDILKAYDGANDLEGTVKRANTNRWAAAGTPPHNITATKGSVHITVNRDFVDYVIHSKTAADFLEWAKKVDIPDETYFSSLNHNPHLGIRGSYKGEPETEQKAKPFLTRFKNWGYPPFNWPCAGQRVRLICIFGIGDLPLLKDRKEMFANKFYLDYEPFTLECMEELHFNRTRDEYLGITHFDASYYRSLAFVKNKVS